jgi:malonate-semialdehyde dehydrogenase (acetylating)/methylmalonate-semialdehyde dehydrogenase
MTALRTLAHFCNGAACDGGSRQLPIVEPATGATIASVRLADRATVTRAIEGAAAAATRWADTPAAKRARILVRFIQLVEAETPALATLLAREHGKTVADATAEIQRGLEAVEYATGICSALRGSYSDNASSGIDSWNLRQPLGVVAGITPFNFPAMIPMWMFGVALATGNTMVLKPSERDPGVPLRLAELLLAAGAPAGVLQVVNGDKEAVDALVEDPRVRAISFVGSSAIAESLYARGAALGKRVQAMGGAKNHMVILPDADLDMVVNHLLGAAYGSAGERCMAISVAVPVGPQTADRLVAALRERVTKLRVGPSLDATSDFGPLVSAEHRARVTGFIERGVAAGAELLVDGRGASVPGHAGGFYLGPCLFDRVRPEMELYREEIFGPVLSVLRADSAEQALALASSHQYGNGVAIYTRSGGQAREFARRVDCGMVGINVPLPVPLSYYSFGGWKRSAYGGFHQHGPDGVAFFTKLKNVLARWPEETDAATFIMPTH